jgi:hypothetical protein
MARRHESLFPLSLEHHDALLLAWRLRTGDLSKREPELRAKHVSAFFEYRLINHLKLEEELLFPAFRAVLGVEASLIDVLLSDHRELRAKAAAIKVGAPDQVDSFCVLLERPYPDRGASTVRAGGESDELHGDGGAGAADKSPAE